MSRFFSRYSVVGVAILFSLEGCAPAGPGPTEVVFTLEEATIEDINAAFDAGALSCEQLVQLYLDRVVAYDDDGPRLNSIITVNSRALDTARALDEERSSTGPRSALHCIPVVLKDNIDTGDMSTTNGSAVLKDAVPPDDAYITSALREAGALILGKASLGEFAGGNSYNSVDGQVVNPYHVGRRAGGSSSGSAVAVAANLAVVGVGTDTSTSVRQPASFNGIVGLRPTTGLISRDGIAPKNLNFDTAGPMARTVADLALLLTAMAGPDPADPDNLNAIVYADHPVGSLAEQFDYSQFLLRGALSGARLGVARDYFGGDPEIDALAEAAIDTLRELGAEIVDPVTFDASFVTNVRRIADYRFKADWEGYLATFGPEVPKTVTEFLERYDTVVAESVFPAEAAVVDLLTRASSTSTDSPDYIDLIDTILPRNTQLKLHLFETHNLDALVFPYHASFAPPISNPTDSVDDPTFVPSGDVPSPSTLAGYSSVGFPSIVVPMGFGTQGLPMAISFLGRPYDEGKLIGYAYDYEQATMHRRPSALAPALPGEVIEYWNE
jgi:amidase